MQRFTSVLSYVLPSDCLEVCLSQQDLFLKFYRASMYLHDVKNLKTRENSNAPRFLPLNYNEISQLCHSYAKGPFCWHRSYHKSIKSLQKEDYLLSLKQDFYMVYFLTKERNFGRGI